MSLVSGPGDRVTEGLCEAGDNGDIVFREVDGLDNAVVVLRVLGGTCKNFLVVLVGIGKVEKARVLFNDASGQPGIKKNMETPM